MATIEHPWRGKPWEAAADEANTGLRGQGYIVHVMMGISRQATCLTVVALALLVVQTFVALWPYIRLALAR